MTEESAVKVCVRVRPFVPRADGSTSSENGKPHQDFWKADKKSIHQLEDGNVTKSFSFDRVFTADESTNQLYQAFGKPLVVSTVEGYNGTIFAYGQTSSGKTFTMMGDGDSGSVPGVIPLAVEDVFQTIKNFPKKEFLLRVSYMEIYNETVVDLLVDKWKRKPLEVRETINKNVFVAELTEELVTSLPQALAWIRKGEKNRHYGTTKMNQRSSRSHTIFRMILESRERSDPASGENADGAIIVSHLNLVDLAGSERASQTGAEGVHFKEGCNINRSLFTLGQVIKKLTDENQKGFTNYRDSKLTRILQNSLGGNAKTVIICTITPDILEDTLSTLQFASTAKKMKNDPRVTEVSDDGALLRRYRNELAELKQRLQEVSSVTQTTAMEKEVLSQLLQEKESLQREQEDRIKNLTKLLVTSSNQIPVVRVPKRRVTWGGKMLKLASPPAFDERPSFSRKRTCLTVMCEDDEEFDSHWGIPDEPPDDLDVGSGQVTVRSFGDSPRDASSECMCEQSRKAWNLELQLGLEIQQKEEAMKKVEALSGVVAELQLQMEVRAREAPPEESGGTPLETESAAERIAELELQLEAEAQEKQGAVEKMATLELRVADLEQQNHSPTEEQTRRGFAETIQLCEALAAEKESVAAERDYLKLELETFVEQTSILEKEKAALLQEVRENREMDEFKSLEEEFRKDQEKEFKQELSSLQTALESSEAQCQELQSKLERVSEELKQKTEFAEELQNMSGKDLVREVATLRRSLDDAEGLSRDTKKEWAHLRSENMALEEMKVTLTASHDRMEAEVNSLRFQLETERSRYKNMQSDLQKELNVAFEENTKLSRLLAGKVPKNLTDSLELEKTVAHLNKELTASREAEETLRAQLVSVPGQMDSLTKQAADALTLVESVQLELQEEKQKSCDLVQLCQQKESDAETRILTLTEELQRERDEKETLVQAEGLDELRAALASVSEERDQLNLDLRENVDIMIEVQEELRTAMEKNRKQKELIKQLETAKTAEPQEPPSDVSAQLEELQAQVKTLNEELDGVRAERAALLCEKDACSQTSSEETETLQRRVTSLSQERDQLQEMLEALRQEKQQLTAQLEDNMEAMQCEFQQPLGSGGLSLKEEQDAQQIQQLQEHLERTTEEISQLRSEVGKQVEQITQLSETLQTVRGEKQQLEDDLQQNQNTASSTQELLKSIQEELQEEKNRKSDLETQTQEKESFYTQQISELSEKLQSVEAERAALLCEKDACSQTSSEETETLQHRVTSLSQERDQLQEMLEALRQEKQQLTAQLEDNMEAMQCEFQQPLGSGGLSLKEEQDAQQIQQLQEHLERTTEEISQLRSQVGKQVEQITQLSETLQTVRGEKQQLEDDLQQNQNTASSTQELLKSIQEELQEEKNRKSDLETQTQEKESFYTQQISELSEKLQSVEAERAALLREKDACSQTSSEETETLQRRVTSLSQERDQLQEMLEALRQEKQQLTAQLEDNMEAVKTLNEELDGVRAERAALLCEKDACSRTSSEEMETLQRRVTSLSQERDQLQEMLEALRQVKQHLTAQLEDTTAALHTEITQLSETLQTVRGEKQQLEDDLQQNQNTASSTQELLKSIQEELQEEKNRKSDLETQTQEKESFYTQQISELSEKLQSMEAERAALLREKDACSRTSSEETETLQRRVTSLSQERDQLQEMLEALRQEKPQLTAQLEDNMEAISGIQEKLKQQEQQSEAGEREEALHQQVQQLAERLQSERQWRTLAEANTDTIQQLLSEANETISALREQISCTETRPPAVRKSASALLQDSTEQLQEVFRNLEPAIAPLAYTADAEAMSDSFQELASLTHSFNVSLPKATTDVFETIRLTAQSLAEKLTTFANRELSQFQSFKQTLEELVKKDVAIFEEQRLQDVLLCRTQAPEYSVKDEDFQGKWEDRLGKLLDKRERYLQKVAGPIATLRSDMRAYVLELRNEFGEKMRSREELYLHLKTQPVNIGLVDGLLRREQQRGAAAAAHIENVVLQSITQKHSGLFEELKQLEAQADSQLRDERSKNSTLLRALGGAPLKTELSLLKDNQQLTQQLQQAEDKVKAVCVENEQLKEAQVKATSWVSNQKRATQLLQTELQDSRALVEEQEDSIQTLKRKLRESECKVSSSAAELNQVRTKLVQMEALLSSASDEHQKELKRMSSVLNEKEESLRKLRETLWKSQQEGEESFLQGKDLYARLTNPRGLVVKSSVMLEKAKLEEEIKQLHEKIAQLETLVSSQQAEISKWKSRTLKLKPPSPTTPTKRGFPFTADPSSLLSSPKKFLATPKKVLDSPRKPLDSPLKVRDSSRKLDSPKSQFFDVAGSSEVLSRTRPKQFFDNSRLGTIPDAAAGTENELWWPLSPKQDEMCKTQ